MEEQRTMSASLKAFVALSISALFAFALTHSAQAITATAFAETQESSSRESLTLEGGYPEVIVVGDLDTEGDNGVVYAGLNSPNGIFVSRNSGVEWRGPASGSDFGTISDVATSNTPGVAFMIGGISLYKTADAGATWDEVGELVDVGQVLHYNTTSETLMVAMRDGTVAISTNDGESFTSAAVADDAAGVSAFGSASNGNLYAIAGAESGTLYESTDGGDTWDATAKTGIGQNPSMAVQPSNPNVFVIASADGIERSVGGADGAYSTVNEGSFGGQHVTFNGDDIYVGAFVSNDNGATWDGLQTNATSTDAPIKGNAFAIDDENGVWYVHTLRGIARSTNDGTTWTDANNGLEGAKVNDVSQAEDKDYVWMAVDGGLARSTDYKTARDAGDEPTWTFPILPDEDENGDSNIESLGAVWIDPDNTDRVLASEVNSTLWRTTDGGDTWTQITVTPVEDDGGTITDIVEDDGTLYLAYYYATEGDDATSGGGVVKSTNNGLTWSDMSMPDAPARRVAPDGNGQLVVGVGTENDDTNATRGVYVYDGSDWTHVSSGSSHALNGAWVTDVMYFPGKDRMYASVAGENGGLFVSEDTADWSAWAAVSSDAIQSDFWGQGLAHDNNFVYASTARPSGTGTIYKCTANGNLCGEYYVGLTDEAFNVMLFDDLISGSNAGAFTYKSKVRLTLKKKRLRGQPKKVVRRKKVRLKATLRDKTTGKKLKNKRVILQYKYKKRRNGRKWRKLKRAQTNSRGVAKFTLKKRRKGGKYRVVFKPYNTALRAQYPTVTRTPKRTIKKYIPAN